MCTNFHVWESNLWTPHKEERWLLKGMNHLQCKQDQDPFLLDFKVNVHKQKVFAIEKGGDSVHKLQGRLCVPRVDGL